MIRRSRAQSSSLFLMELILAILFFSVTSAVCVQFFVKSHLLSRDSKILSQAVNECANIAEIYDASDSIDDALLSLADAYPDLVSKETASGTAAKANVYYDDTFSPCTKEKCSYTLTADFTEANTLLESVIQVTASDNSVVYELNTSHHAARRTDYEKR